MEKNIRQQFFEYYGKEALIVSAPGRVNLIGEHTDYNEGFVLPGAIDKKIYAAIAKNNQNTLEVYAGQYKEKFSFSLNNIKPVKGWATYLLGIIYFLQQQKKSIDGIDVWIDGNVPVGAGMSSSAALCAAFGLALNELFGLGLTRIELALIGQKTEHHFAGVKCGIMDQFASLHGKSGHVIKLDCRSLEFEYIPFQYPEYKIVLVNTMVSHSLAGTEYNIRRQQCEEGVQIFRKHFPGIHSLRDISIPQLEQYREDLPDIIYRRCHFVVFENDRLLQGCKLLSKGDLDGFGQLMYEAHDGLSNWYEVSCPESDFLTEHAKLFGVTGARQMGGGFGGCTINIIKNDMVEKFSQYVSTVYEKEFKKIPDIYITQIEDGAKVV
ncbi:MAG TPA: galactokinase [Puia sp.]|nr:galactokinase [Puia sp.]